MALLSCPVLGRVDNIEGAVIELQVEGRQASPDVGEDIAQPRILHPREGSDDAARGSPGSATPQDLPPSEFRCLLRHMHGACDEQSHNAYATGSATVMREAMCGRQAPRIVLPPG